ncbi:alpha/beta hydrolase [bacterium]|nr:MAG: alpha/beta hydrolase [bacterium]
MKNISTSLIQRIIPAALLGLMAFGPVSAQAQTPTKKAPTGVKNIVLVHGAFADGSSWARVIPLLQAKGYNVIAVQNPLTSLADDVAATKRAISNLRGPVLLVGHSWGGVVITQAGTDARVKGLVYVAAAAPNVNQSIVDMSKGGKPPAGSKATAPDAAGFLMLTKQGALNDFAQDLPLSERKLIYPTQGPWALKAVNDKVSVTAWKSKPTWYIVAAKDRMINPDLERSLAKRMKATTLELNSGHVPMLSQPAKVAEFLIKAAQKTPSK